MKILLSMILVLSFTFSGCTKVVKEYVYVKKECPRIEPLTIVPSIELTVDAEGKITDQSIDGLIKGAKALRRSEKYYYEQVSKYNEEFTIDTQE